VPPVLRASSRRFFAGINVTAASSRV